MALKRKLSAEFDDVPRANGKQAKLVPFPNSSDLDSDVAMSDASMSDLEPLAIPAHPYHIRLPSNASYASSASSDSPRNSLFDLYPVEADSYMSISAHGFPDASVNAPQKAVGLIQPKGNGFTHHGQNCTQIPKLRMACSAGPNGRRSMWAHCEECGAIEMVDSD
ncbi:hypothetical protein K466DRAFT_500486 [Polyporus arcularius HHB13444]|uniref:Uncharacterized protein n=1 Tax=Polyporus arcularius HHB13444 TaxID=1314778 RepID=A0A5C3P966_9APHY|nr:hypothetical protein K466DRAFT_500486 [Polyporus arcularius HHB13444]